ncbi:MAG: SagB/ThcOx family dehydrogenase, partial [Bacteroidales bacterium]|nr:SagB/ThcOx family dehydrogenase [Bacteroidales bacterium]
MKRLIPQVMLFTFIFHLTGCSQEKVIKLPQPQTSGGMPLMEALMKRGTSREFSSKELDLQTLSNLLWAANGINRPEDG